ncbi:hypothetical protein RIF29_16631 [Crotalaria pallida]|uniref:Uncharacterized protein n=1 Tax=Crotalaria pallida TaxID=3830 RepID=A0AAN9IDS8_CROPI
MAGSSSASKSRPSSPRAEHLLVDDFYFSALHDADELFPISDEKYAEQLMLQEALFSSAMSIPRVTKEVMQVNVKVEVIDNHLSAPLVKVKEEKIDQSSDQLVFFFCAICMDSKPAREMFRVQIVLTLSNVLCTVQGVVISFATYVDQPGVRTMLTFAGGIEITKTSINMIYLSIVNKATSEWTNENF